MLLLNQLIKTLLFVSLRINDKTMTTTKTNYNDYAGESKLLESADSETVADATCGTAVYSLW